MTAPSQFLVTGGNGYLASWILKLLLEQGHHVRATVRSSPDSARYAHLHQMAAEHEGRLTLHQADLLDGERFVPLAEGCDYILHTASPFVIEGVENAEEELVRPAMEGTRHVLQAATQSSTVKRVIMTSSAAAIYGDSADGKNLAGRSFSEEDWNTSSSLKHQPYAYSKTLAERTAWEVAAQQNRWELVTLNPGFILGPSLSPENTGVSHTVMKNFASGTYRGGIIDVWYGLVDVRDVAEAHLRACDATTPGGRYIISNEDGSLWMIAQQLRRVFGDDYPLPRRKAPKPLLWLLAPRFGLTRAFVSRNIGIPVHLDNRKSRRDLGMCYRPIAETLWDHFHSIITSGWKGKEATADQGTAMSVSQLMRAPST